MEGLRGTGTHTNVNPYWLVRKLNEISAKLDLLGIKAYPHTWEASVDAQIKRNTPLIDQLDVD